MLKGAITHHYFLKCIVCQNMRCCSNSQNMICLSYLDRHVFHPSYNKSSDDIEIHFRIKVRRLKNCIFQFSHSFCRIGKDFWWFFLFQTQISFGGSLKYGIYVNISIRSYSSPSSIGKLKFDYISKSNNHCTPILRIHVRAFLVLLLTRMYRISFEFLVQGVSFVAVIFQF